MTLRGPLSAKQIENLRKRGEAVEDGAMSPASSLIQIRNVYIKTGKAE